jgi:hypothetical protein
MNTLSEIAEALQAEFDDRLEAVDFDLTFEGGEIDIATDDWTMHLEAGSGWIAIDNEPEDDSGYAIALRDAFQSREIEAIRAANDAVDGAIGELLAGSGDPLSAAFADMIGPE